EGQRVERDQAVVEILTDKTDSEIPAPTAGVIVKLLVNEGDTVPIGAKLLEIDESGVASVGAASAPTASAPAAAAAGGAAVASAEPATSGEPGRASPAVRKLAREMDLDLGRVEGTGQGGVITRDDVLRAAQGTASATPVEGNGQQPGPRPTPPARAT